jgi:hypothetical protein
VAPADTLVAAGVCVADAVAVFAVMEGEVVGAAVVDVEVVAGVGVPAADARIAVGAIRLSSTTTGNSPARKRMAPTVGRTAPDDLAEFITDG